jgi:hypothetical protein
VKGRRETRFQRALDATLALPSALTCFGVAALQAGSYVAFQIRKKSSVLSLKHRTGSPSAAHQPFAPFALLAVPERFVHTHVLDYSTDRLPCESLVPPCPVSPASSSRFNSAR